MQLNFKEVSADDVIWQLTVCDIYKKNCMWRRCSNIAIDADDTTLYSKCDQASDLWQQLELASEFESDLQDTADWSRHRVSFVDFDAGKTQLVLFERSKSTGAIDAKMAYQLHLGISPSPFLPPWLAEIFKPCASRCSKNALPGCACS